MDANLDSLPYIDAAPNDTQRAAARALIANELPGDWASTLHPRLPAISIPSSSTSGEDLIARASRKDKLSAIDVSRYGDAALERPTSSPSDPGHLQDWRDALKRAYIPYSYLGARSQQLSLLEAYGKNAWLIGNNQVEEELRSLEKRLADVKEETERVNRERMQGQEAIRGEIEGLDQSWRSGVERLLQVQVATAEMEEEMQRLQANGSTSTA